MQLWELFFFFISIMLELGEFIWTVPFNNKAIQSTLSKTLRKAFSKDIKRNTRQHKITIWKGKCLYFKSTRGMFHITEEHATSAKLGHKPMEHGQPLHSNYLCHSSTFDLGHGVLFFLCLSLPQSAVYLAGPQCTVHDPLPAQGVHQGDEWRGAAPTVLLPGEGTRLLWRWAYPCHCLRKFMKNIQGSVWLTVGTLLSFASRVKCVTLVHT